MGMLLIDEAPHPLLYPRGMQLPSIHADVRYVDDHPPFFLGTSMCVIDRISGTCAGHQGASCQPVSEPKKNTHCPANIYLTRRLMEVACVLMGVCSSTAFTFSKLPLPFMLTCAPQLDDAIAALTITAC